MQVKPAASPLGVLAMVGSMLVYAFAVGTGPSPGVYVGSTFDAAKRDSADPGWVELYPQTGQIVPLEPDPDVYLYSEATFDPVRRIEYFSDGESLYGYVFRNGSRILGMDRLLDTRKCFEEQSCFGEFHWSTKMNGIVAVALGWPAPKKSALVLLDPYQWSKAPFNTSWIHTTEVMPLDIDSYIEGQTALDDETFTFFLMREVMSSGYSGQQYAIVACDISSKKQRVLVPEYAPSPFVVLPRSGMLLGFNAGDPGLKGQPLVVVNMTTGAVRGFGSSVRFTGLPAQQSFACDSQGDECVVIVYDLNYTSSKPVLYRIGVRAQTISKPIPLAHTLRYLAYFP